MGIQKIFRTSITLVHDWKVLKTDVMMSFNQLAMIPLAVITLKMNIAIKFKSLICSREYCNNGTYHSFQL